MVETSGTPEPAGRGEVLAQLRGLGDQELLAVLLDATAGRAGLAPVHAAAAALSAGAPGPDFPPAGPDFPPDPTRPVVPPEVPPPLTMSTESPGTAPDYTEAGVPTFDRVRDKMEERFGTALGSRDLDRESAAGRDVDEQWQARERAAQDRLDRIRRSVRGD